MNRGRDDERTPLDPQVFRAIAEFTYDWESWVDGSGRLAWVNAAVERITGYTVQECLAQKDYPLAIAHPDDRLLLREISAQAERGGSANHVEFRILRKDGEVRFGAISYQPIFDGSGASLGYRSSVRDIEERKQMEERLRELVRHAEQANRAKTHFLANVSHELRTPLQSLLSYAELLGLADIAEEYRGFGRAIHRESQHLARLVSDLLDYAALTGGDLSIAERAYSPAEEFEVRLGALHAQAQNKGLLLEWSLPEPEFRVTGDPDRALQILTNLTKNAIEYTAHGKVHVECVLDVARSKLRIVVRDTGPGLPEGSRLFEPFQRGRPGDASPGFGLGLAITSRLCERMGGSLKAGAAPGGGAEMVAEFSVGQAGVAGPGAPAMAPGVTERPLLVIDDVASVREALMAAARALGLEVFSTDSLRVALAELARRPDAVVLLDMNMPGVSVLESARQLRARLGQKGRLIAMSASPLGREGPALEEAGVDGFLAKPITLEQLKQLGRGEALGRFAEPKGVRLVSREQGGPSASDDSELWNSARVQELLSTPSPKGGSMADWLLGRFQDEMPKLVESVADSTRGANGSRKVLHDLAGTAAILGAPFFQRRFLELEEQALASPPEPGEVARLAASLLDGFAEQLDALRRT